MIELHRELNMNGSEFDRAYLAAGRSFGNRLSDIFIVLNESNAAASPAKMNSVARDLSQLGKAKRGRPDHGNSPEANTSKNKRPSTKSSKANSKPKEQKAN